MYLLFQIKREKRCITIDPKIAEANCEVKLEITLSILHPLLEPNAPRRWTTVHVVGPLICFIFVLA